VQRRAPASISTSAGCRASSCRRPVPEHGAGQTIFLSRKSSICAGV
jgi:hypothetical protein